jgi:phage I-like protein
MKRIRAYAGSLLSAPADQTQNWTPPDSLEWMPAGTHDVATMTGDFKVTCSERDAIALDKHLQELLAKAEAGKSSRPYIDFQHDGGAAAAIPTRFFWQDGIRLAVEWTQAGLDALKGRVFSYFSPEFYLGDNGHPISLPDLGPIGALVNTPAFQSIERLAAAAAINKPEEVTASTTKDSTMESFVKRLCDAGIIPQTGQPLNEEQILDQLTKLKVSAESCSKQCSAEADRAVKAEARATEAEAKVATLDAEIQKVKASQKAELEARADADVVEAIKSGKILESAKDSWKAMYLANPDTVRASLSSITVNTKPAGHPNTDLPGSKVQEVAPLNRVQAAFKAQLAAAKATRN